MIIIKPKVTLESKIDKEDVAMFIERCGRVCYKSEDKIDVGSAERFINSLIKRGHESVLEHFSVTLRIVCDRAVSHEIVRHRIASFSQESQRYCNYQKDSFGSTITVIEPSSIQRDSEEWEIWKRACIESEKAYLSLIDHGMTPQQARAVLPNSTKTEIVMTANIREWRHFLKLRLSKAAHPDMRVIAKQVLDIFRTWLPMFVSDISEQ